MKPITAPASLLLLAASPASSDDSQRCQDLSSQLNLPNTTITGISFVKEGTNLTFPNPAESCLSYQVADADVCRVSLNVTTGPASNIIMDSWLPISWNGRFLGVGNGGLSGCVKYNDLNYGARHGFATIGTNNGHDGGRGTPFLNNPGVVEDYVYRSIHLEAEIGKHIIKQFYGEDPNKSYYLGCSTGGRQGFKEAQDFPEDFDGIVAGAPAFNMLALFYWTAQFYIKTGTTDSPSFLSPAQWEIVYKDILRQCDGIDGVVDGVLEDPNLCDYRPESLICGEEAEDLCLTGEQAGTVRAVFSPVYGADGKLVYPRLQPGANATEIFFNGEPHPYPLDWYRYVVYSDPEWSMDNLDYSTYLASQQTDQFNVSTWKGDLSRARDRGTKIIHYHGLEDNAISSENSAVYYNHVSRTMGFASNELDDFYRYFRISGMAHCRAGNGANFIGGNEETFSSYEPDANVLAAIVRWVEEGVAPEYLLGTTHEGNTIEGKVIGQRKHCKYPGRNVYKGHGDSNSPESWHCI